MNVFILRDTHKVLGPLFSDLFHFKALITERWTNNNVDTICTLSIILHEDGVGAAPVPGHHKPHAHLDVGDGGQGLGGVLVHQGVHVVHLVCVHHPPPRAGHALCHHGVLTWHTNCCH